MGLSDGDCTILLNLVTTCMRADLTGRQYRWPVGAATGCITVSPLHPATFSLTALRCAALRCVCALQAGKVLLDISALPSGQAILELLLEMTEQAQARAAKHGGKDKGTRTMPAASITIDGIMCPVRAQAWAYVGPRGPTLLSTGSACCWVFL